MKISLQSLYNWYRQAIRHPQYRWWVILGTIVYFLSPLDISPDIFPIAGQIDDIAVITLLVTELFQILLEDNKYRPANTVSSSEAAKGETIDVEAVAAE